MEKLGWYFLIFISYSVLGWIFEVAVVSFVNKKWMARGFLIGPWIPLYGIGGLLVYIFLSKYISDPWFLFLNSALLTSILEYATSYIMEKLFRTRWWDYSNQRFNINGRITLLHSLEFGLIGVLAIYFINPVMFKLIDFINNWVIISILAILFIIDVIISFRYMNEIKKKLVANGVKLTDKDYSEEVRHELSLMFAADSVVIKRIFDSFPDLKVIFSKKDKEKFEQRRLDNTLAFKIKNKISQFKKK